MGDASMSQQAPMPDPNMMGGEQQMPDPNQMGGDPNMMNDPNQMGDPNMDMGGDPNMMGGEPDMMGGDMGDGNASKAKKDIQKNIGKACNDYRNYQGQDKEDLGKWITGMLDSLDGEDDENADTEVNGDSIEQEPQMPMESVIFKKKQLDKLNEIFGADNLSSDKELKNEKPKNNSVKNTPFNNPDYGK